MKCPECQFENREGAKFCNECGHKFEIKCPECGTTNRLGSKFCDECGYDLQKPAKITPIDYSLPQSYTPKHLKDKILTTRSSIEGERKLVTVFFADVANYTTISEKLDPEEVHQIMDGFFQILMDEIHKYEGTINQFTGDGVMALFGAPVAHEDHAQRACYAALSVQRAMRAYGEKIKSDTGIDFQMRIGLNSGHVIVGSIGDDLRMDYTAVGDTTNLASRMESAAKPGGILVSVNTHRLARSFFEFESLGKIEVKGKEKPQAAYSLIKAGEVGSRLGAAIAKGLTRFVGRKNSMAALMEPYEKVRKGSGQVVGIVGEAGVGKSRLVLEMRNRVPQEEYTYLEGRCIHYGGSIAYLPILDILRVYLGIQETDREFIIKKKIQEKTTALDSSLINAIPPLQEFFSLKVEDEQYMNQDPQMKRMQTFEALRDLFIRESQQKTLVLVIEDMHWIDKTSEEFLDYFIGWIANARILLILLYRPEYTHQWGSKSYYSKIGVDQLGTESSSELVAAMLEEGEVAPELRTIILKRSGGNPLFMEEFTSTLLENGTIQKKNHHYVLAHDVSDVNVPDTIQGIIAARMDRLEDNLKRTMQVASVIGRDFAFRILQAITGMREELKSYLLNLQGLEFIYEKALFPELEYIFKHALTQEVAYNSLLQRRRKDIHERIGQAIEEIYADRLGEFYGMLAYHYSKAENLEKAVRYGEYAASRAVSVYAYSEAVGILEETIRVQKSLDPEDKEKQCDLHISLCSALNGAGEYRRVFKQEAYTALALAEEIENPELVSRVCIAALHALMPYRASIDFTLPETHEWTERAERYVEPNTASRILVDLFLGAIKFSGDQKEEGIALFERALNLSRQREDPIFFMQAANNRLQYVWAPQHAENHLVLAEEMVEKWRKEIKSHPGILWHAARVFLSWGQRKRCEEIWREIQDFTEQTGVAYSQSLSTVIDILRATLDGRLEEALDLCIYLIDQGEELGIPEFAMGMYSTINVRPLSHLRKALLSTRIHIITPPGMRAFDLAYLGRSTEAKEILEEHVVGRPNMGSKADETATWEDTLFLEAAVLTEHREAANLLLCRLDGCKYSTTDEVFSTIIPRHLGAAAAMLDRLDDAKSHYHDAFKVASEMKFRPELALTRFQLAELLLKHYPEEKEEALEHLEFALKEFAEMKMAPSLKEAQAFESAHSLIEGGREEEILSIAKEIKRSYPHFSLNRWAGHLPFKNEDDRVRFIEATREAGLYKKEEGVYESTSIKWNSDEDGVGKDGEFTRKSPPAFSFKYPTDFVRQNQPINPGEIFSITTLDDTPSIDVSIAKVIGKLNEQMKEYEEPYIRDLEKWGTNITVIYNRPLPPETHGEDHPALELEFNWMYNATFPLTSYVHVVAKEGYWISISVHMGRSREGIEWIKGIFNTIDLEC